MAKDDLRMLTEQQLVSILETYGSVVLNEVRDAFRGVMSRGLVTITQDGSSVLAVPDQARISVLRAVNDERDRQDLKWGVQDHTKMKWLNILMEEVGEASRAILEGDSRAYVNEMEQVAAVAVAALENVIRLTGARI